MPRGILPEETLQTVKDYIVGNRSYLSHANELGVSETVFRRWVNKYHTREELVQAITVFIDYYINDHLQRCFDVLTPFKFHERLLAV